MGKTTLAKSSPHVIFDLENPRDLVALEQPQLALEGLEGLIMIDEVQRKPELFPLIRFLVDHYPRQRYLLSGSASSPLRCNSESLAGSMVITYGLNTTETGWDHTHTL